MSHTVFIEPLLPGGFAPFGDVIHASGQPSVMINNGQCARYSNLAKLDFAQSGQAGISVFLGKPYSLPHRLPMVERHPLGSQAFLPMSEAPFLVIVAQDNSGQPSDLKAFLTTGQQGVNIHRGVWHGVLTPLNATAQFAVVDWIGPENNSQEFHFREAIWVRHSNGPA